MEKDFDKTFAAMLEKPSVVAHRKLEFCEKALKFQSQQFMTQTLKKEKLDKSPFILFGMTLEGYSVHGDGQHFFVANGYAPEGSNVSLRENENFCKIIMSCCFMLEHQTYPRHSIYLRPLCEINQSTMQDTSDEIALDSQKVNAVFERIISEQKADFDGRIQLVKIKLTSHSRAMLCWSRLIQFRDSGQVKLLLCDVDNGCFYYAKESEMEYLLPASPLSENLTTDFSCYYNNFNERLIRNEHSRSKGGIGVFYG